MGKRVVVLASGAGSNLQVLLDAEFDGSVVAVLTDRRPAGALDRARAAGVHADCVPFDAYAGRDAWSEALADTIAGFEPDLVVLAGFMRILPPAVVARWPMLNVHPSLLPAFPGARAVEAALDWGVKVTGTTVHFVDEEVDHGPIVAQEAVTVSPDDTAASLHERIKEVEHRLLPEAVAFFCADRLHIQGRHVRIDP